MLLTAWCRYLPFIGVGPERRNNFLKVTKADVDSGLQHARVLSPLAPGGKHEPWGRPEGPGRFGEQLEEEGGSKEVAGHEAGVDGGGGSLCPECQRPSSVVSLKELNNQLSRKKKRPSSEVFANIRGVSVPTVAYYKLSV